jgi:hypothetical protein
MRVLRTAEERFAGLPDFGYEPRYADVGGLRLAAWRQLAAWDKPFLVAFSDRDPITGQMAPVLKRTVPGAAGRHHPVLAGAGHFLQEDAGEEFGAIIADFIRASLRPGMVAFPYQSGSAGLAGSSAPSPETSGTTSSLGSKPPSPATAASS